MSTYQQIGQTNDRSFFNTSYNQYSKTIITCQLPTTRTTTNNSSDTRTFSLSNQHSSLAKQSPSESDSLGLSTPSLQKKKTRSKKKNQQTEKLNKRFFGLGKKKKEKKKSGNKMTKKNKKVNRFCSYAELAKVSNTKPTKTVESYKTVSQSKEKTRKKKTPKQRFPFFKTSTKTNKSNKETIETEDSFVSFTDPLMAEELENYSSIVDQFSFNTSSSRKQHRLKKRFSDIQITTGIELATKSFKKIPYCHRLSISTKGIEIVETVKKNQSKDFKYHSQKIIACSGLKQELERRSTIAGELVDYKTASSEEEPLCPSPLCKEEEDKFESDILKGKRQSSISDIFELEDDDEVDIDQTTTDKEERRVFNFSFLTNKETLNDCE